MTPSTEPLVAVSEAAREAVIETAKAMYAYDEKHLPVRHNVRYVDLPSYRQHAYENAARAAIAVLATANCSYCDGTGDVHRADGEWLGRCPCATADNGQALSSPHAGRREALDNAEQFMRHTMQCAVHVDDGQCDCGFRRIKAKLSGALASPQPPQDEMGWQPIETAPRDGTIILVSGRYPEGPYMIIARWFDGYWKPATQRDGDYKLAEEQPTHWMPLPPVPVDRAALTSQGGEHA